MQSIFQEENQKVASEHTPSLPPCQLHLVDPAHRVGPGVQGGLSLRLDPSLQWGPGTITVALHLVRVTQLCDHLSLMMDLKKKLKIFFFEVENKQDKQ